MPSNADDMMITGKKQKIPAETNVCDEGNTTNEFCDANTLNSNQCDTPCLSCEHLKTERAKLIHKYERRIKKMQNRLKKVRDRVQKMQAIKRNALELKQKTIENEKLLEKAKVT